MRKILDQLSLTWQGNRTASNAPTVLVIAGPCGSGKSTVAQALATRLQLPLIEGDEMHTIAARDMMSSCIPLDFEHRMSWLAHLRGAVIDRLHHTRAPAVLATCSALKGCYRDELRSLQSIAGYRVAFLMLDIEDREELKLRLCFRQGHYMQAAMVEAQVDDLEVQLEDEFDLVPVNASQPVEQVVRECEDLVRDFLV